MALAAVVEPLLPGFLGGAVVVLGFVGRSPSFVADTVPCWGDMALVWERFCLGVCRGPSFTVTWCAYLEKIVGESGFSEQFGELVGRCGRAGCGLDVVRRDACLVVGPVVVDGYASLFNCTTAVRASDPMTASS